MSEEYCPECGAKITGKTGFCSECGAVTTSLNNQIEETKKIERIENIQKWYHKPDKSHMMALIYSILLPFSGTLVQRLITLLSCLLDHLKPLILKGWYTFKVTLPSFISTKQ